MNKRRVLIVILGVLWVVLNICSWWYFQESICVGDLKTGTGDIKRALTLEDIAYYFNLAGVIDGCTALMVIYYGKLAQFWLRSVLLLALSPIIASINFLFIISPFVSYQRCP